MLLASGDILSPLRGSANMIVRLAVICLLLATSAGLAEDSEPSPLERDGRALAERMCSECHAIDKSGQSPHVGAPAFRALDRRVDLDTFMDRLRELGRWQIFENIFDRLLSHCLRVVLLSASWRNFPDGWIGLARYGPRLRSRSWSLSRRRSSSACAAATWAWISWPRCR